MRKIMKVQIEGVLENQSLARAISAAYAGEADPTMEEIIEIKKKQ